MAKVSTNRDLHKAKNAKKDEFHTQLSDIEKEIWHYREHFKDQVGLKNLYMMTNGIVDDPYARIIIKNKKMWKLIWKQKK